MGTSTSAAFSVTAPQGYLSNSFIEPYQEPSLTRQFARNRTGIDDLRELSPAVVFNHTIDVANKYDLEIIDAKPTLDTSPATFVPFIYEPFDHGKVMRNIIFIQNEKGGSPRSSDDIKLSRYHEEDHGEAWNICPELWASPYSMTRYVLSPEDWIASVILTEQSAYAKGTLKAYLNGDQSVRAACETSLVSFEDLEGFCRESPDLRTALDKAGDFAMSKIKLKMNSSDPSVTIFEHYCRSAMDDYRLSERLNDGRLDWRVNRKGEKPDLGLVRYGRPVFVRMSSDATLIGETLGIPGFRQDFQGKVAEIISKFPPDVKKWIEQENHWWGIENKNNLPTLKEAVAADGLTMEDYSKQLRGYVWTPEIEKAAIIKQNEFIASRQPQAQHDLVAA